MPSSIIPSFVLYCFVSAITPGPANLCSLACAIKYGRSRALRQWRGLFCGYATVSLAASVVVWFLGSVLNRYIRVMVWIGAAYILWLAWNILHSDSSADAEANAKCNFFTGFFLQLTNPKAIVFCVTTLTIYALPYASGYWDVLKIALILPFTGPVGNLGWLFTGASLKQFFQNHQKPINIAMAAALAFCAFSIIRS